MLTPNIARTGLVALLCAGATVLAGCSGSSPHVRASATLASATRATPVESSAASASAQPTVTSSGPTGASEALLVSNEAGYSFQLTFYGLTISSTSNVADQTPGEAAIYPHLVASLSVMNATSGRNASLPAILAHVRPAWPASSPVCKDVTDGVATLEQAPSSGSLGDFTALPYCTLNIAVALPGDPTTDTTLGVSETRTFDGSTTGDQPANDLEHGSQLTLAESDLRTVTAAVDQPAFWIVTSAGVKPDGEPDKPCFAGEDVIAVTAGGPAICAST